MIETLNRSVFIKLFIKSLYFLKRKINFSVESLFPYFNLGLFLWKECKLDVLEQGWGVKGCLNTQEAVKRVSSTFFWAAAGLRAAGAADVAAALLRTALTAANAAEHDEEEGAHDDQQNGQPVWNRPHPQIRRGSSRFRHEFRQTHGKRWAWFPDPSLRWCLRLHRWSSNTSHCPTTSPRLWPGQPLITKKPTFTLENTEPGV